MEEYNGFYVDQCDTVYELLNGDYYCVGKLNGRSLKQWVDEYYMSEAF